ncbi:hypothetical protein BCR41DRAFT_344936 [Lobosporangium transversale]|uniref:Uncharacterized protein n=1 Tax=Lobosporangium transversale TaxID=64571 RepID=A0A1Y2H2L9_9FUNG|nr:hypothetical protein BCR41DRAFT_344936 [Lobosporangium transversale]ORZ28264.1 hypothetical protein BCR41DRAFT_344936 [Lobosporangium transversale]|eukprot:XP_021885949.1 hypothetical protein BCR41DRAFT_344936 [Lobosporangium transversale]
MTVVIASSVSLFFPFRVLRMRHQASHNHSEFMHAYISKKPLIVIKKQHLVTKKKSLLFDGSF